MSESSKLHHPWLVAVWPGLGNVALNAGVYLLAKLGMNMVAELSASGLFDVEYVEVNKGLLQLGRRPRNLFFLWKDPKERHDLIVFLGEAQPPLGKYEFCRQVIEFARGNQVERIFTFAAMATGMHPDQPSRVFVAATDPTTLGELQPLNLEVLQDGHVGGLNGLLLGVAAESGLHGACLLGEMPHVFSRFPYPKASQAILEVFTSYAGIEIDFAELAEQAANMQRQLGEFMEQVEQQFESPESSEDEAIVASARDQDILTPADRQRIEELFAQAAQTRAKAFELKQELDRLGVFKEYEDRFLDLFKK